MCLCSPISWLITIILPDFLITCRLLCILLMFCNMVSSWHCYVNVQVQEIRLSGHHSAMQIMAIKHPVMHSPSCVVLGLNICSPFCVCKTEFVNLGLFVDLAAKADSHIVVTMLWCHIISTNVQVWTHWSKGIEKWGILICLANCLCHCYRNWLSCDMQHIWSLSNINQT